MSRAKAADYMSSKYKGRAEDLLRGDHGDGGGGGGTWVVCEDKQLVWEEAGEAYKDVWDVGGDLVKRGVAEKMGWCRPVVSYKVRKE